MAGNGLGVKDLAEIKRLWGLELKNRKIAEITGVYRNTINKYVAQFINEKSQPLNVLATAAATPDVNQVDWLKVRTEFLSGVSLNVIHEELLEQNRITAHYSGHSLEALGARRWSCREE